MSPNATEQTNTLTLPIFTARDAEFATRYRGTLKGFEAISADDIAGIKAIWTLNEKGIHTPRKEFLAVFNFYYDKVRLLMDTLLTKENPQEGSEFKNLWQSISDELNQSHLIVNTKPTDFLLTIRASFIRALILASNAGSPAAQELLSNVPGMSLFFASLLDTPPFLLNEGESPIPAWQHSAQACLFNLANKDVKAKNVYGTSYLGSLNHDFAQQIKKKAREKGLLSKVYLPMPGYGKIGLTTLVKMWLHHVYVVPMTYDPYKAHGIELGSAVGALHDIAHGILDDRTKHVRQAIHHLLEKEDEKVKLMPQAVDIMVTRYNRFNEILLEYIDNKQAQFITLWDQEDSTPERKGILKQAYNRGIVALFLALHEEGTFNAAVLEAPTFELAIKRFSGENETTPILTTDASSKEVPFNYFDTCFNPASDLTDAEIIDKLKDLDLKLVGIYPVYDYSVSQRTDYKPPRDCKTLRDYEHKLDFTNAQISRGPIYTQVSFIHKSNGATINAKIVTAHYLVDTAKDQNAVLKLADQDVNEARLLHATTLYEMDQKTALNWVKSWYDDVANRTKTMILGLAEDVITHTSLKTRVAYDELVKTQNDNWGSLKK